MKTRSVICLAALVTFLAAGTPMAAAQTFLGEFCWWYTEDIPCLASIPRCEIPQVLLPLKAGVTHLGGAYYLLQGRVDRADLGNVPPLFLQATGVMVGDDAWLNGSTTRDDGTILGETVRESGIMQLRLSRSTLNGSFWRIETDISTTDGFNASFGQRYITGWVWFAGGVTSTGACP